MIDSPTSPEREAKIRELLWDEGKTIEFDSTMRFGKGYDFEGLECLAEEAETALGRFVIWPDCLGGSKNWALYGGTLGIFVARYPTRDAVKAAVFAMHKGALTALEKLEAEKVK